MKDTIDFLANHVIREYKMNETWEGNLKGFFFTHDTIQKYDRIAFTALKNVFFKVVGKSGESRLVQSLYDTDSGILSIAAVTTSESLSIALSKEVFYSLGRFYVFSESEKQRRIYEMVRVETDSLRGEIVSAERRLLAFSDQNMGLSLKQYEARKTGYQEEVSKLSIAFGESFKNLQSSEMALLNTIPFIQEIDLPIIPIRPSKPSPIKAAITSGALWAFLTVLFVIVRRVILNILDKDMGPPINMVDREEDEEEEEDPPGFIKRIKLKIWGLWTKYNPIGYILKKLSTILHKLKRRN